MPKTKKKFDWEIYEGENFLDMLSMSRNEMKEYQKNHPEYSIKEVGYTDDGDDSTRKTDCEERRDIYRIRVPRR